MTYDSAGQMADSRQYSFEASGVGVDGSQDSEQSVERAVRCIGWQRAWTVIAYCQGGSGNHTWSQVLLGRSSAIHLQHSSRLIAEIV